MTRITPINEEYARRLSVGKETASDIYRDLYPKSRKWKDNAVHVMASLLTRKLAIRIRSLQQAADDASIATRREIMQGATERFRGRMGNFVTAGADGVIPNVGPENVNSISLKGLTSRCVTTGEGDGKKDAIVTHLEIFDPLTGADMLNKMRKEYETGGEKEQPLVIILRQRECPIRSENPAIEVSPKKKVASHGAK